jgi:hypothetical protein
LFGTIFFLGGVQPETLRSHPQGSGLNTLVPSDQPLDSMAVLHFGLPSAISRDAENNTIQSSVVEDQMMVP